MKTTGDDLSTVRVAILGGGLISGTHAQALQRVEGAELAGCVGGDGSRRRAAELGVPHVVDLDRALEELEPHAVIVCTPSAFHAAHGIDAARRGLHVLVEKPIDSSVSEAQRLVHTCEREGVRLSVVSQRRFDDGYARLRELVEGGRLGRLTLGSAALKCWRDGSYYRSALSGDSALANQGIHIVDMLCGLLGPVARVRAVSRAAAHGPDVEDVACAVLEFANGAVGTLEASTAFFTTASGPAVANTVERLEVAGTAGSAILSGGRLMHCDVEPEGPIPDSPGQSSGDALLLDSFARQHRDFIDAVRTGRPPTVTGADGLRAIELVDAVRRSARTGAVVDLG